MNRSVRLVLALAAFFMVSVQPAAAQIEHKQVISANPFGLLLELFNGEYERVVSQSSTVGLGGSFFPQDSTNYVNGDVFYRYYPQGRALEGWAFGVKIGLTRVSDSGTYFGYGFDLNHSRLLGNENRFYIGLGFGLKRLVGVPEEDDLIDFVPTFRIVNVGVAF